MSRFLATTAALLVAALCGAPVALAQDQPKDDALDRLLKKAADEPKPAAEKPKDGEVKDPALDDLLKKLGQTKETPAPSGPKVPGPGGPAPVKPDDVNAEKLKGKTKDLDEHLEELTGRIKKKPPQDGKPQDKDDDSSELAQAIKKMREVEQRLSKPDTGDETRKKQAEIVKELDRLIQMAKRSSQSQSMQRRMAQQARQGGKQPGNQPGQPNQGTDGKGVGPQKPRHYTPREILAQNKDTWGNLPPQLREEMMNVFKEEPLPTRQALIDRYTLSVSKKSLAGKE